jgi:hypothetical protein
MGLQNRTETLKQKIAQSPEQVSSTMRNELLGGAAGAKRRVFGETAETTGMDNQSVYAMQQKKIDQQDQRLDQISAQVGRITRVGQEINDELTEHNRLLGGMEVKIEKTSSRVDSETLRIDTLKKEAGTAGCWLLIIALFIVIIVLVLLIILT